MSTSEKTPNATFYTFKPSGKYCTSGRGHLPQSAFEPCYLGHVDARRLTVAANNDKLPGLSGPGAHFTVLVVPDEDLDYGWPLLWPSTEE